MSIIIKGMMMPVNCQTCPFVQNEYPIGGETLVYRCRCTFTQVLADKPAFERNKDCPLVEIPPHGRLIDAEQPIKEIEDAIENIDRDFSLLDFNSRYCMERGLRMAMASLKTAPTIIEAEGERE